MILQLLFHSRSIIILHKTARLFNRLTGSYDIAMSRCSNQEPNKRSVEFAILGSINKLCVGCKIWTKRCLKNLCIWSKLNSPCENYSIPTNTVKKPMYYTLSYTTSVITFYHASRPLKQNQTHTQKQSIHRRENERKRAKERKSGNGNIVIDLKNYEACGFPCSAPVCVRDHWFLSLQGKVTSIAAPAFIYFYC